MKHKMMVMALALLLFLTACAQTAPPEPPPEPQPGTLAISFNYQKQSGSASNQFAVWIEDLDGNLVKTLYAAKYTAAGGYKVREDSLKVWVAKAMGVTDFDAVAGATPKSGPVRYVWDLTDEGGKAVAPGVYVFNVEGTLRWKDYVLFTGEIAVGGADALAIAEASFFTEKGSAPERGMLTNVRAEYIGGEG